MQSSTAHHTFCPPPTTILSLAAESVPSYTPPSRSSGAWLTPPVPVFNRLGLTAVYSSIHLMLCLALGREMSFLTHWSLSFSHEGQQDITGPYVTYQGKRCCKTGLSLHTTVSSALRTMRPTGRLVSNMLLPNPGKTLHSRLKDVCETRPEMFKNC
jgi:hypothetical protein